MGMSWWEAIIAIIAGNIISAILLVLNSLPGAYYHVGFPVVNRSVWGMWGSQFVIWNRIFLSIMWCKFMSSPACYFLERRYTDIIVTDGFQAWIGGECVYVCLKAIWPSIEEGIPNHMAQSTGVTTAQFLGYIIFMVISMPFMYIRPHRLQSLFYVSATIVMVFIVVLLIWSMATMGPQGFGETISISSGHAGGWNIAFGIISTIGSIAAGLLNQNDYARFARKPSDAIQGQAIVFAPYAVFSCIVGILVTGATERRYGKAYWNLPDLFGAMIESGGTRSRCAAFFGGFALIVSQIGVNVAGNALAGGEFLV